MLRRYLVPHIDVSILYARCQNLLLTFLPGIFGKFRCDTARLMEGASELMKVYCTTAYRDNNPVNIPA